MPMSEDRRILARMVRHIQAMDDDPFTPLLDEYLIARLDRDAPRLETHVDLRPRYRPGKRLSPSGIGGCERAAVFSFTGMRGAKRVDPRTELIFENGDWYHHKWQALMQDMELVLGSDRIKVAAIEERVQHPKLYILGYLDVRVAFEIEGKMEWVTVDVKSINDRGFRAVTNAGAPLPEHKKQVITYCKAAGTKYGALLYENKNDSDHQFFLFRYDKQIWAEVKTWCQRVLGFLDKKSLPPKHPDCEQGTFQYERCQYRRLCFGNMDRVQLKQMAFKNFPGVDVLWEQGQQEEAEDEQ